MKTKIYIRLTLKERVVIETLLQENKSKADIAKRLNRSRSTITREMNFPCKSFAFLIIT